jgi:hypothetical protein
VQINSPESMKLARAIFEEAGRDWELVRKASTMNEEGVLVIDRARLRRFAEQEANGPDAGDGR